MTDAAGSPASGAPGASAAWLARLGPLAAERPPPSIGRAMGGIGGVLVAAGVITLGGQRWASSGSSGVAVVLCLAMLAAGVAAIVRSPPPLAVAGVGASGVAAPALAFFVLAGGGFPSPREVALLAGILLAALFMVGPWRGHTFHLAILVGSGWLLALSFADLGIERSAFGGFGTTLGDTLSAAGAASMVLGVIYLGLGSWLHDNGLEGMATPFLGVAALALPAGAFLVARDLGDGGAGLVGVVVGGAIALVGARCRRRGTTWLGLAVAVLGVLVLAGAVSDRTGVVAVALALAGSALVFAAPLAATLAGEPGPGPEPPPPAAPVPDDGPPLMGDGGTWAAPGSRVTGPRTARASDPGTTAPGDELAR